MLSYYAAGPAGLQLARALAPCVANGLRGLAARAWQTQPSVAEAATLPLPYFHPAAFNVRSQLQPDPELGSLRPKERAMVRLYIAGCYHQWPKLPGARARRARGGAGPAGRGGRLSGLSPARAPSRSLRVAESPTCERSKARAHIFTF